VEADAQTYGFAKHLPAILGYRRSDTNGPDFDAETTGLLLSRGLQVQVLPGAPAAFLAFWRPYHRYWSVALVACLLGALVPVEWTMFGMSSFHRDKVFKPFRVFSVAGLKDAFPLSSDLSRNRLQEVMSLVVSSARHLQCAVAARTQPSMRGGYWSTP